MSIICLSLAPILRCNGLTHTFASTLLIAPGLAFLVSITLLFVRRNGDRKRLLLVGEGLVYFILSILDFASKVIPTTQLSLSMFKGLDITVGALSDVPIFLYCLFLLLFVRAALVKGLPLMMQRVFYMIFLFTLPAVLIVNACASFVGFSYKSMDLFGAGKLTVGIQLNPGHSTDMWEFLSGWTLALLGFAQFIVFFLTFARIVRPPKTSGKYSTIGLYLIAAGLLLGAIECMVGFAAYTTTVVFVRRSLHSFARALIVVGLIAGVDEDILSTTLSQKSSIRSRIGSPEPNSFVRMGGEGESVLEKPMQPVQVDPEVQLQRTQTIIQDMKNATFNPFEPRTPATPPLPTATSAENQDPFADEPAIIVQAPALERGKLTRSARSGNHEDFPTLPSSVARPRPAKPDATDRSAQRVTLHYDSASGVAPHLEMRLSGFDLPSPSAILASLRKFDNLRPNSDPLANGLSQPRLPRTATMAGSLAQLRQQYVDEEKAGGNWYPFRGSPTPRRSNTTTGVHSRDRSSLTSFSTSADIEAGDPANDPKPSSLRHSRTQTVDGIPHRHSRGHFSTVSGISYMSDASEFVKNITPRFPDIPPMPSRVMSMMVSPLEPGALVHSPFADPNAETEEDAARAIRGPRLPPLDTALPTPQTFGHSPTSGVSYNDETPSTASTRRRSSVDVPMSALASPELVHVQKANELARMRSVETTALRSTPLVTPATAGRASVPIEHFMFDLRTNLATAGSERISTVSAYTVASPVSVVHAE